MEEGVGGECDKLENTRMEVSEDRWRGQVLWRGKDSEGQATGKRF